MSILAEATEQACRDVFQTEIPHYFTDLYDSGNESVAPRVENVRGRTGDDPRCVVQIIGCTGIGPAAGIAADFLNPTSSSPRICSKADSWK